MTVRHVPSEYSTIQSAVNASVAYDIILIHTGFYNESITIPSGLNSLKILRKGQVTLDGQSTLGSAFTVQANNVEIRKLRMINYTNIAVVALSPASGLRLIQNVFVSCKQVVQVSGLLSFIYKNKCNTGSVGFQISGKDHYIIQNQLQSYTSTALDASTFGNHFIANCILDCESGMQEIQGQNLIFANRFIRCVDGIICASLTGGSFIANNTFDGGNTLLRLLSPNNLVLENIFKNSTGVGGAAVQVIPSFDPSDHQTIERNVFETNQVALDLRSNNNFIYANTFKQNTIDYAILTPAPTGNVYLLNVPQPLFPTNENLILSVPSVLYPTIESAVLAAQPWSTIVINPGKYDESAVPFTIPIGKDGLRLLSASCQHRPCITQSSGVVSIAASFVQLERLTFKNVQTVTTTSVFPRFLYNTFKDSPTQGLVSSNSFSFCAWHNHIEHNMNQGLQIDSMNNWVIGNHIKCNGGDGILISNANDFGNALIQNSLTDNNGNGIEDNAGANLSWKNKSSKNKQHGVWEASQGQGQALIVDNCIRKNDGWGILLQTFNNYLKGNEVSNNLTGGITYQPTS
ncbi:MAG: hypothetical protein Sylvanvirus10_26 [Sylvanvirus sp.]|uniref:Right handed beta helix domain-containing protein n=1 Tax=Sylvanvirus sp. TaxID=2487774 RepID=A0A3G5ALH6_9VIRU|nr:MAG: hypothetical protein Sylvanvirus10_26 [Sylvanvirus sp.]